MSRRLLALVGAALAVAGCTSSQAGTAQPQPSTTQTTTAVQRPRDLDLSHVDACKTLTAEQQAQYGVDSQPRPGSSGGQSLLAGSPGCTFLSEQRQTTILVLASTKMGLPEFIERTGTRPSRKNIEVKGYPAISEEGNLSAPERGSGACFVTVDVADGQLLDVQFSQVAASQDKRLPIETLCARAAEVAGAAVTTLQGG
jgi:Protein of unknown function (DUF3558)